MRTAAAVVLYDTTTRCTYSSLEPLLPGAAYIPGTWYGTCKHPTDHTISEVRGSVSRVKTPSEKGLPHYTHVLQPEQHLPHATEWNAKRGFPMERGPTATHHPAWNPQCTQWFRAEEVPLLCPTPKVMPRFNIGDVGDPRWPRSHRWTDTSPILPDAAHDSRNQGRVVSLSVLSIFSACVRLCQLLEVHHSLQQALNYWSRTQSAATDGSPACCTSSLMLRACVMLRVLPSQSSVRSLLVLLLYKQRCWSGLARPVGVL